jgi:poly(glycerol-phosphate) alpha-glucosyltransferase
VATLKPLKRIEHGIEAVATLHRRGGRAPEFGLDVYGKDAGSQASLERVIAATGSAAYVKLHGYTPGAAAKFAEASFSLMTSTTEGQSLVLLESMAAGCVPISYDVRYGPDELLIDGETGFLVPPGDVAALADTIERFLSLPARRVRQLREAGRERLAAFSDEEVYRRWVAVQQAAVDARRRRLVLTEVDVPRFTIGTEAGRFTLEAEAHLGWDTSGWTDDGLPAAPTASWLLVGRDSGKPDRRPLGVEADVRPDGAVLRLSGAFDPAGVALGEKVADVYVEVVAGSSARRHRLRGEAAAEVSRGQVYATGYGNVSLRKR